MPQRFKLIATLMGFALALGVYLLCVMAGGLETPAAVTAAVTALCAAWWCTEAMPIPVTAMVPFAVFPLAGVLDHKQLAAAYGDRFILLFMAGFMLSRAAEKSNTHLRVARGMMRLVGTSSARRVVIGFLLATAFCSMWISNTAAALIMLPVGLAVVQSNPGDKRFGAAMMLAIAYGASIGGMATLIGTPPNGIFASVYQTMTRRTIAFDDWLVLGLPAAALMLVGAAVVLTARVTGAGGGAPQNLGPWSPAQRRTLAVLSVTVLLWVTRSSPNGGWSAWLAVPEAEDATVGLLAVIAMFLIPSGRTDADGHREHLLDWPTAQDIPWGILILFGGGIAIAQAFQSTGLTDRVGESLRGLATMHPLIVIGLVCLAVTFLSEVTSNTAITALLMPIMGATAAGAGLDPAVLMVPAAMAASCGFMLPVATPPNAIVFAGGHITIPQMVRAGLLLDLIGVVVVTLVCYLAVDRAGIGTLIP